MKIVNPNIINKGGKLYVDLGDNVPSTPLNCDLHLTLSWEHNPIKQMIVDCVVQNMDKSLPEIEQELFNIGNGLWDLEGISVRTVKHFTEDYIGVDVSKLDGRHIINRIQLRAPRRKWIYYANK